MNVWKLPAGRKPKQSVDMQESVTSMWQIWEIKKQKKFFLIAKKKM
jgi:hypothetical protein